MEKIELKKLPYHYKIHIIFDKIIGTVYTFKTTDRAEQRALNDILERRGITEYSDAGCHKHFLKALRKIDKLY